jgi:hypothetical protein
MSRAPQPTKICLNCACGFSKDPRYSRRYWERQKFCSQACAGLYHAKQAPISRPPIAEAFFTKVEKTATCWLWKGLTDADGYGAFPYAKRLYRAHRLSLELAGAVVPKGAFVCHHCDNPQCVNPAHLYVGTPQSNVADKVARGRVPRGEQRWWSKLTEQDVRAIRSASGTHASIAEAYGVARSNVSLIKAGRIWGHVK